MIVSLLLFHVSIIASNDHALLPRFTILIPTFRSVPNLLGALPVPVPAATTY